MGNYTAIATRIKVKKTAPKEVTGFLDSLYQVPFAERVTKPQIPVLRDFPLHVIEDLEGQLQGMSSYFETYEWRVKEDKDDHWLYESRSSAKNSNEGLFLILLSNIVEHLVVEVGDILFRSVSEESNTERVAFYDGTEGFNGFVSRDGFTYRSYYGEGTDSRHPKMMKYQPLVHELKAQGIFNPLTRRRLNPDYELPWNVQEVAAMLNEEKADRDAALRNNWM